MRFELPETTPPAIRRLPRTLAGYPIPWFAAKVDGKLDIRVADGRKLNLAMKRGLCWVCGHPLLRIGRGTPAGWFVIGPMCAINRVSSEPPSHEECALFSARNCPFLVRPNRRRNDSNLPEDASMSGTGILRNPGTCLVWKSNSYFRFDIGNGRWLVNVGDPLAVSWWARGRPASREEVDESISTGLPILRQTAEEEGPAAVAALEYMTARIEPLLPVAA